MRTPHYVLALLLAFSFTAASAQQAVLRGTVTDKSGSPVPSASILLPQLRIGVKTDSLGNYRIGGLTAGKVHLSVTMIGYLPYHAELDVNDSTAHTVVLEAQAATLDEVVVSGTLKEVSKLDSPVPVEVYSSAFFKANPTPSIFDALQNINGVRPQLNCNICNTGDIHINGLEGPYTMILIDGMPIVSGLSSVYGLSGIPQSLIDRVEIVKGPASTLYGSEAVGGLVNIITKKPEHAPAISGDVFGTSWGELNSDLAARFRFGKKATSLLGVNHFTYQHPLDNNKDGFTDVTLQRRVSIFNKWSFARKYDRLFSVAGRYIYEDRWGGEMNWNRTFRGGSDVYGESVYTKRWELFGLYQLPGKENLVFTFSTNGHDQNSVYGDVSYIANQFVGFGQLTWSKRLANHDLLSGAAYRYTRYDDNTPATASQSLTRLPGIFVQDEVALNDQHKLLLGLRYDYNSIHGSILTPRVNYKWNSKNKKNILRLSFGNGYRVANVFTEDHAALTGSRDVVFREDLKPETSWNGNLNFVKKITAGTTFIGLDATAFYTYFSNKIIADYDTDPNTISYDNLAGHAISQGISLNMDVAFRNGLKMLVGGTAMNVYSEENHIKIRQLFTERFTGVWNIGYTNRRSGLTVDYTGNVYGPMRLPLAGDRDPRREFSSWWSIQNIQLTKIFTGGFEVYGGMKNLLNWTPNRGNPFIIARANDPFDKRVQFDNTGKTVPTAENPYALTFDPAYVYGPNQGIRGFLGVRVKY